MSSIPQQTTPSPPPPPPVYDEEVNESIFSLPLPQTLPSLTPNPTPLIQSDLYVQGPSSGVIYSDPPPHRNKQKNNIKRNYIIKVLIVGFDYVVPFLKISFDSKFCYDEVFMYNKCT